MVVEYRRLLDSVAELTGVGAGEARAAAESTIGALAATLDEESRGRLLAAVPPQLCDRLPSPTGPRYAPISQQGGFVRQVAVRQRRTPTQASRQVRAVLYALAEQDPGLLDGLRLPAEVRDEVRDLAVPGGRGTAARSG